MNIKILAILFILVVFHYSNMYSQVVKFIKNPVTAKYRVYITKDPKEATIFVYKVKKYEEAIGAGLFYIVENPDGTHFLDQGYTVFGQTIGGIEVVHKIAEQAKDFRDRPNKAIWMTVQVKEMKKKKITKLYGYKYE